MVDSEHPQDEHSGNERWMNDAPTPTDVDIGDVISIRVAFIVIAAVGSVIFGAVGSESGLDGLLGAALFVIPALMLWIGITLGTIAIELRKANRINSRR